MKTKLIIGICILFLLNLPIVFACTNVTTAFYGECEFEGDIKIIDEQNNIVSTEFYSTDSGCYDGKYSIEVSGGVEDDCAVQEGESLRFYLNDNELAQAEFHSYSKVNELDLVGDEVSYPLQMLVLFLIVLAIAVYYIMRGRK